jgi:hypothetical protein
VKLSRSWKSVLLLAAGCSAALYGQGGSGSGTHGAATPPNLECPVKARHVTYGVNDSGDVITGPVCISVQFNALHFSAELGRTVTFTAGPALATQIATAPTGGGQGANLAPTTVTVGDIENRFTALSGQWSGLAALNIDATATVAKAVNALQAFVTQSDDIYRTTGAAAVIAAGNDARLQAIITSAHTAAGNWSASDKIQLGLDSLQSAISLLLLSNPSAADKATLTGLQAQITAMSTAIAPSAIAGDKTTAFYKQVAIVDFWDRIIHSLTPDAFVISTYVTCGVTVNQTKTIAVKLFTADRTPSFTSQPVTLTAAKDPFVTVSCPSPFAISGGVEMRFLKTSTFGLVPSGTTGANQFGITQNQSTIPMAIALAHVRLIEDSASRFGLFGSFGIAAHSQGSGTAGSAAEYLAGATFGLFRTMFITAGAHIGQVSTLAGGYKVGDAVPTGVTTVPVTGSYKVGFGLAISFSKP